MAARGPHIQKFVILAATLCCDDLNISWRDKLTLNIVLIPCWQIYSSFGAMVSNETRITTFRQFNFIPIKILSSLPYKE